jgi:cytosine/adenosine deaminase-related metal-dependent hydrolase
MMGDRWDKDTTTLETPEACRQDTDASARGEPSRRDFLRSSAGLVAGGAVTQMLPGRTLAQDVSAADADAELRGLRGQRRILLKGGVVLTLDPQIGDFTEADVLIEAGKIVEVRPNILVSGESTAVVDASNRIVIPGFVDTHHHCYQGILRNILPNGSLADYMRDVNTVLTNAYEPADAYSGALATALGAIEQGITTVVDTSQVSHTPEHTDACIRGLQEAGIRAVFAYWGGRPGTQYPRDIVRLQRTYFSSPDQLLTLAMASTLDEQIFSFAREVGVRTVSHGVNSNTEQTLLALGRAGLLGPGDEYIHCNHLSDAAWRLIGDTGGHASIAVPIEMAMGHGLPPIQDALDHGVRPSLSSDVDTTMTQDFFTLMRSTFTLQRLQLLQRARNGEQDLPPLLTCREVLELATVEGARGADLQRKVGTLTPGKEADIVLLRADRLNVWPLNNAPGAVVNIMDPSNVDTVFIAGKVMKWRGSLVGVDVPRVLRLAQEARDAVVRRAGIQPDLLG